MAHAPPRGRLAEVHTLRDSFAAAEKRTRTCAPKRWSLPRLVPPGEPLSRVAATGKCCGAFSRRTWPHGTQRRLEMPDHGPACYRISSPIGTHAVPFFHTLPP